MGVAETSGAHSAVIDLLPQPIALCVWGQGNPEMTGPDLEVPSRGRRRGGSRGTQKLGVEAKRL